jgi:hypothetical protein
MTNREISRAILHLRPNVQFSLSGDNYDDVVWIDKVTAPTKAEIENTIKLLPQIEADNEAAAKAKKEAAEAKLTALGLTKEDLEALGL